MKSSGHKHISLAADELGTGETTDAKVTALCSLLRELSPLLVAFSGGVDSTVVLRAAVRAVGPEHVLAVTAHGDVHTEEELASAQETAARLGVSHRVIDTKELAVPGFADNPPERCYLCKVALYGELLQIARTQDLQTVVDGANADDSGDYRPGLEATKTVGVRSPLAEVGLGKADVRALAREWGLPEWDRPSSPCLASRFPYGESITPDALEKVASAERYLKGLGLETVRVRHHGNLARIEVSVDDLPRLVGAVDASEGSGEAVRRAIVDHLHELGYVYVALDMEGFRSGSLNEALQAAAAEEE